MHARARQRALEAAASGLRVNRASDDAAASARGVELEVRARSYAVARRGAERMGDLMSEADAKLGMATELIFRARELATQAANDTYTPVQRDAIAAEFGQTLVEYARIVMDASGAGRRTLARSAVDVGIVVDNTRSMDREIAEVAAGLDAFVEDLGDRGLDLRLGLATMHSGGAGDPLDGVTRVQDLDAGDISGILAGIPLNGGRVDALAAALQVAGVQDIPGSNDPDAFSWRDDAFRRLIIVSDTDREADLVPGDETSASVGSALAAAGITVDTIGSGRAEDVLRDLANASGGTFAEMSNDGDGVGAALLAFAQSIAPFGDSSPLEMLGGVDSDTRFETGLPANASPGAVGINGLSLATPEDARAAMEALAGAVEHIGEQRARLGASMRRVALVADQLGKRQEQMEATRARIVEADYANVSATLAKTEALQDVGVMVARRSHEVWAAAHRTLMSSAG